MKEKKRTLSLVVCKSYSCIVALALVDLLALLEVVGVAARATEVSSDDRTAAADEAAATQYRGQDDGEKSITLVGLLLLVLVLGVGESLAVGVAPVADRASVPRHVVGVVAVVAAGRVDRWLSVSLRNRVCEVGDISLGQCNDRSEHGRNHKDGIHRHY